MPIVRWLKSLARTTKPIDPKAVGQNWFFVKPPETKVPLTPWLTFQVAAIASCVDLISGFISQLPWDVRQERPDGGSDVNTTHPAAKLLKRRANVELAACDWRQMMMIHALLWGNGYSEIERDTQGRPLGLWPVFPNEVQTSRNESGELIYVVNQGLQNERVLPASKMFHLRHRSFDGINGVSPLAYHARTIGLGVAIEQFAASYFGNGAWPGGFIKPPYVLDEETTQEWYKSFEQRHQGGNKAHKIGILPFGSDWVPATSDNEKSQFIESRKFQIIEICRLFRVPPHKIYDLERATFSNIVEQNIEFVQDQMPWIRRLEQEADLKLFSDRSDLFTKLDINAVLRGDPERRGKFYEILYRIGATSIDEIRGWEDLNPVRHGDTHFVQVNMQTLDNAVKAPPEPMQQPVQNPSVEDTEEESAEPEADLTAVAFLRDAIRRELRKEYYHARNAEKDEAKLNEPGVFENRMLSFYDKQWERMFLSFRRPLECLAGLRGFVGSLNDVLSVQIKSYVDKQKNALPGCEDLRLDEDSRVEELLQAICLALMSGDGAMNNGNGKS